MAQKTKNQLLQELQNARNNRPAQPTQPPMNFPMPPMPQMPTPPRYSVPTTPSGSNPVGGYMDWLTTPEEMQKHYGFEVSKDSAVQQAEVIRKAKEDALNLNKKLANNRLMSSTQTLDNNSFKQQLNLAQQQTNNGINAGIAADQDLRLQMGRQQAMGDIYRDNNAQNYEIDQNMGRLEPEKLAYADELYNQRLQQMFQNAMAVDNQKQNYYGMDLQNQQATNQLNENARQFDETLGWDKDKFGQTLNWDKEQYYTNMGEDSRRYDLEFGLKEGELTGNYLPSYLRGNPYNNPFVGASTMSTMSAPTDGTPAGQPRNLLYDLLKQKEVAENKNTSPEDRAVASATANDIRMQLASHGIDPSTISAGVRSTQAMANMANLNPTLGKQAQDAEIALREGELTGRYVNPEQSELIRQLLGLKHSAENGTGNADTKYQADMIRNQLASMGVDPNKFSSTTSLADALKNYSSMGQETLGRYQTDLNAQLERARMENELNKFGQTMTNDNYWKNINQQNWEKTYDNDNYWKGVQQDNWEKEHELSALPQSADLNEYTGQLNNVFLEKSEEGNYTVKDSDGLYEAIIGLNLNDEDTTRLLSMYGIEIGNFQE